ncbi:MAG TPA: protease complex subunit PrcB family protein [Candidatus Paceibacterota bacterium]|nr:protease complex subunit PrcB family protein [Candidatus Paceibacterota bacterium]
MRDVLIIGIACAAAILLGAWLYFSDPHVTGQSDVPAFTILDEGMYSGEVTERKNYRIKSQEELEALWLLVHGTGAPTNVDFARSEVIAVFDGTHATGGYGISIASVADVAGSPRVITILHTEPGTSCLTTDAISSPYQIAIVSKSAAPLTREEETIVTECN